MAVRATFTLQDAGAARANVLKSMGDVAIKRGHQIGRDMVTEANQRMGATWNLNRGYDRRRDPGSRRASTALDYHLEGHQLPIVISYRVLGGDNVLRRIIILNFGAGRHNIRPSGNWPLTGRGNASHFVRFKSGAGLPRILSWPDGAATSVSHPGSAGSHFLEEGMAAAVARNTG